MARRCTFRVDLGYDGRRFHGYARQPGRRTVESVLRECLAACVPDFSAMACAGRTDRGVSARQQVISFTTRQPPKPNDLRAALAQSLPPDVRVRRVRAVDRSFHARASATARCYRYLVPGPPAWCAPLVARLRCLEGAHDFRPFARRVPPDRSTIRTLRRIDGRPLPRDFVAIYLWGDGFLRRQVRVMMATAMRDMMENRPADHLCRYLEDPKRWVTAPPAPPEPLSLWAVRFDAP